MSRTTVEIIKIPIVSTSASSVLDEIASFAREKSLPRLIFTPNAEFLVAASRNPEFKRALESSDLNLPDGFGLILAGKILGQSIRERVSGASLVEKLLKIGNEENWKIGIAGARRGDQREAKTLFKKLQERYPNIKFVNLDEPGLFDYASWFNLVLACQGMIKQENWIIENKNKVKAGVFMGVGGSLDFLTGFTRRAPIWIGGLGLEWLWRGLTKPGHWTRVWTAVVEFSVLVIKERFRKFQIKY